MYLAQHLYQLFVLAPNHPASAAQAINNRWFAPPVEFLRLFLAQNSTKKTLFHPPSRFWEGAGGWVIAQTGFAARAYTHQLFVLAPNHPASAAQAINNRWFAPPVEFLPPVLGAAPIPALRFST